MPSAARSWVGVLDKSESKNWIRPPEALRRPITLFMSVVLPAPLRPMRPAIVPGGTSSETPRRICTDWIATFRFSTFSTLFPAFIHTVKFSANNKTANFGVVQCHLGRRIGDDAAVIKGEHARGEAGHHLHVVLDEEHGGALRSGRPHHRVHDAELLPGRDAA